MAGYGLLIGNGLNRCHGFPSWDALLANIASPYLLDRIQAAPNTIKFESIVSSLLDEKAPPRPALPDLITATKERIIAELKQYDGLDQRGQDIRVRLFKELDPAFILTTNYDYMLEEAWRSAKGLEPSLGEGNRTEIKYNLYRRIDMGSLPFYHIHGEMDRKASIVLGYEHYAGTIEKMRASKVDLEKNPHSNPFLVLNSSDEPQVSWLNEALRHPLYVMGLSLGDYTEIDLWWFLVYRAYILKTFPAYERHRIVYLALRNEEGQTKTDKLASKRQEETLESVLHSLDIDYVAIEVGQGGYYQGYLKVFDRIRREAGSGDK